MILLLLGTNLFFTMENDVLIDGDGNKTRGRGEGNYNEEDYFPLTNEDIDLFYYVDTNEDNFYSPKNDTVEPLIYNQTYNNTFNYTILVGYIASNDTLVPLKDALNYEFIWYVDENQDGNYSIGESIYLENGDGDQKLTYNYLAGPLYLLILLFFFGFIIASMANLFLFYRKTHDKSIKKPVYYLIFGLLAIIIFILSQSFISFLIPVIILDSAITLIITLFFTVAVLKYNIVDIKLIIRKSMFYSLASLIVVASFVLVEEGMEMLFAEFAFSGSVLSGVIAAFVALIFFSSIRRGLRHQVDKLFPAVRYLDKEYQNRISAYKSTLYAMLADGVISTKEASAMNILRDKLEITPKEHEDLMRTIKQEMRFGTSSY